ncbi:MAG: lipid A biosynthesis acyltransferase [Hydrogenophaga sp.]|uniref:LpxL/LpxP family acyltransferase n=1 Tax=Hydrogenophaga sp. TaxID=1904254 RepID=UPI003D9BA9A9
MTLSARLKSLRKPLADRWGNALGLGLMRVLARAPLPLVRALGWVFGRTLHAVAGRRRRIARTNWALCFPDLPEAQRHAAVRQHFVRFAQAWLDRSWLWHGAPETVNRRLRLSGEVAALAGDTPTVFFAPHFVGLDAGWTALTSQLERRFCTIYAEQLNQSVDRWILAGRQRFGQAHIVPRRQGLKPLVAALRAGEPLYLLPDMDYGAADSVFVPFYGVPAATITSLSRFARLARAQVVPVISRLTPQGYEVVVLPRWEGYPTDDPVADTARMNALLQDMIATMPEQYFWVHKRFKTRPPGQAKLYGDD